MSSLKLIEAFDRWREQRTDLVLATVIDTAGSTYSKPGARILISAEGDYQGLISGGCLEGDLITHAERVRSTDTPEIVTYDMRDPDDDLWGLGSGCNGMFSILLQPLRADSDYQPFAAMADLMKAGVRATAWIAVSESNARLPVGATLVLDADTVYYTGADDVVAEQLVQECRSIDADPVGNVQRLMIDEIEVSVLHARLEPVPRLLVLGAGPDALPLITISRALGWYVSAFDHRPAYVTKANSNGIEVTLLEGTETLKELIEPVTFSAAIIMSHHLDSDREYLCTLIDSDIQYIGVLGPAARTQRLLDELKVDKKEVQGRIFGPVGLDLGADSADSIALAMLSEIHAKRHGGTGKSLNEVGT